MTPLSYKSFFCLYFSLIFPFLQESFFTLGCSGVSSALMSLAASQAPFFEADAQQ